MGFASGVVVSDDGRVLTAKHVLPSDSILSSRQYRISGLIGWEIPTTDFSRAPELDVASVYGAQLKLRPDKKIELIVEPMDQQ
jgi:S1-C subfamily serine protease